MENVSFRLGLTPVAFSFLSVSLSVCSVLFRGPVQSDSLHTPMVLYAP